MVAGTGLAAKDALKDKDPTGRERSKTERVSRLVGGTLGGMAGVSLGSRLGRGFAGPMLGGIGGSILGEKVVSLPFSGVPRPAPVYQAPVRQAPVAQPYINTPEMVR